MEDPRSTNTYKFEFDLDPVTLEASYRILRIDGEQIAFDEAVEAYARMFCIINSLQAAQLQLNNEEFKGIFGTESSMQNSPKNKKNTKQAEFDARQEQIQTAVIHDAKIRMKEILEQNARTTSTAPEQPFNIN